MKLHPDTTAAPASHEKQAHCPCCDRPTAHLRVLTGNKGKGMIYRCAACDLRRLLPLPDSTAEPEDGFGMYAKQTKQFNPVYAQQVDNAVEGYLERFRVLGRRVRTMLDLGGGMGYYTRAFAKKGLSVTYLDRDPVSIGFAEPLNKPLGIETLDQPIESYADEPTNKQRFDLVFFRHVIEHCPHPDLMLKAARQVCAPGGLIVIESDNNRSVQHLLHPGAGPFWHSVYRDMYQQRSLVNLCLKRPLAINKDMTHYYAFRAENLRMLVERTGWRVLDLFDYSLGDQTFWPNIDRPGSRGFWKVRRKIDLARAVAYTLANPLMRAAHMGAGLAVFATPEQICNRKHNQNELPDNLAVNAPKPRAMPVGTACEAVLNAPGQAVSLKSS